MYQRVGASAYKKDLTNTWLLAEHLNNPHKNLKCIHVAGTNGKGSVSHMLASVLQQAGYSVGLYTSPHLIDFRECDFAETEIPEGKGVVMFNPEYGERLGEQSELEVTYKRIGDFMKQKCKGYSGFIFTGNPDLAKKIGLKASKKIEFYNGKLDCRLLQYELYDGSKREPLVVNS